MPTAKHSKAYLLKLLGFKAGKEELFRNIRNMGLVIEREDDQEIEVEFPANRPDLISTVGLARVVRYFMRKSRKFGYRIGAREEGFTINVGRHVQRIRPYISGLVVRNMALSEQDLLQIINFTEKLSETYGRKREHIAIGLHDLKNVKPPFYYDAFEDEEYVPLNKSRKMRYSEVLRSEEKGRSYGTLGRRGERYVALKDAIGTISLIPILNSERTRVTEGMEEMFVDITGSSKFVIEKIADMLAADFVDMGYAVSSIAVDYSGRMSVVPRMESSTISMPLEQINKEIGIAIGFNNVILLANKMGYEAVLVGKQVKFKVPAYRIDIINEQDVIEDIAIAYGYDYIQPIPIATTRGGSLEEASVQTSRVSEAMIGLGYSEMLNSYLTDEQVNFERMRLERSSSYMSISNPKTETLTMLRTWLLPSLLNNLSQSMHEKLPIRIFELDLTFDFLRNEPQEHYHLAAAACGAQVNFNGIKATFEGLSGKLGIECQVAEADHKSFIEGRCAKVTIGKREIGFFGELHPEVLANFGIEEPVVAMELNLQNLQLSSKTQAL